MYPPFLTVFTGLFVAVLVLIPSLSSKFIALGPLYLPAGTLIFPIAFILNSLLTEVYGYARTRLIIWTAIGCQVFAALSYWIAGLWPPAPFWPNQEAYMTILGIAPRITLASFSAFFCGEFANSILMSRMKYRHRGELGGKQVARFAASALVGEGVDSLVFMLVGFFGTLASSDLIHTTFTLWVVKVLYQVLLLPLSIRCTNWVKTVERIDKIDFPEETNYNPFAVFVIGGGSARGKK